MAFSLRAMRVHRGPRHAPRRVVERHAPRAGVVALEAARLAAAAAQQARVARRQQRESLLAHDDGVQVLVVVVVERAHAAVVAAPEVDGIGQRAQRLGGPGQHRRHVRRQRGEVAGEAAVLRAHVRHRVGVRVVERSVQSAQKGGERHALLARQREDVAAVLRAAQHGVAAAVRRHVHGDGRRAGGGAKVAVVAPARRRRPRAHHARDDARPARRNILALARRSASAQALCSAEGGLRSAPGTPALSGTRCGR